VKGDDRQEEKDEKIQTETALKIGHL